MNIESHVENLQAKHTDIESVISKEQLRPQPDTMRIRMLKKEKLRIKEAMESFST